ncbi:hypothetical protein, partial [Pseudonocardia nigra]|uniref:hypothetical protein n=1 Tax=Pseudonocardia nigra TaxID=1921578 RepID=UPI001FECE8A6
GGGPPYGEDRGDRGPRRDADDRRSGGRPYDRERGGERPDRGSRRDDGGRDERRGGGRPEDRRSAGRPDGREGREGGRRRDADERRGPRYDREDGARGRDDRRGGYQRAGGAAGSRGDRPERPRRERPGAGAPTERVTVPAVPEPPLSEEITAGSLDAEVRRDLRGLQKDTAERVARHLVAAGSLVDEDPELALEHARFARRRASRIAVAREAAGIAAYHAGEWAEALGELRAARRMGGGPGHLAVMADIERALGRPERALELARGPEAGELDRADAIELTIVAAGARRDLGELDAAVVSLQIPELDAGRRDPWSARLFYAYADNLLAAGRESDALQWFVHAADADTDGGTDAQRRIAELTGEPLPEDDDEHIVFGEEELAAVADEGPGSASDPVGDTEPEETERADAAALVDEPAGADAPREPEQAQDTAEPDESAELRTDAAGESGETADADAADDPAPATDADPADPAAAPGEGTDGERTEGER